MKKKIIIFAIDILLSVIFLTIFGIFYYIIPQTQESLNIQSIITSNSSVASAASITPDATEKTNGNSNALTTSTKSSKGRTKNRTVASEESANTNLTTAVENIANYEENGVKINIQTFLTEDEKVEYIVSDIVVDDVQKIKTYMANDTYGSRYVDSVPNMSNAVNAIFAVNGDYYGNSTSGIVARNGIIYRANPTSQDILTLYTDGSMEIKNYSSFNTQEEANKGLWQAWTFGPSLLDADGKALTSFQTSGHMSSKNPRTVIGYYGPNHYAILVVNGRGTSEGLTLNDLAKLCENLGFKIAYNLDGGKSSVLIYDDAIINTPPQGGREISDIIYIAKENTND